MHSATPATGRPTQPPGKTVAKNRPALFIDRPACHRDAHAELASQKFYPEHAFIQLFRNCMNRNEKRFSNRNRTHVSAKYRFPRAPNEMAKSPATERSRRQSGDWRSQAMRRRDPGRGTQTTTHESGVANHSFTLGALCERPITTHSLSNRHTSRLEMVVFHRKQTPGTHSNRHLFTVLARDFASARRAPRKEPAISNRQWRIFEINVNHTKQTLGTRSNRHFFAVITRSSETSTETARHSTLACPENRRAAGSKGLCFWGDRNFRPRRSNFASVTFQQGNALSKKGKRGNDQTGRNYGVTSSESQMTPGAQPGVAVLTNHQPASPAGGSPFTTPSLPPIPDTPSTGL